MPTILQFLHGVTECTRQRIGKSFESGKFKVERLKLRVEYYGL